MIVLQHYFVGQILILASDREEAFGNCETGKICRFLGFELSSCTHTVGTLINTTKKPFSIIEEGLAFSVAQGLKFHVFGSYNLLPNKHVGYLEVDPC